MAAAVWTSFEQLLTDAAGVLAGGSVTVYQDNTTTLISLFSDEGLTASAANPITLDSAGRHAMRFFAAESYKTVVKNSGGTTITTHDDIDPSVPLGTGVLAVANKLDISGSHLSEALSGSSPRKFDVDQLEADPRARGLEAVEVFDVQLNLRHVGHARLLSRRST